MLYVFWCQSTKVLCIEMHSSIRTEDVRVVIYPCNQPHVPMRPNDSANLIS